MSKDISYANALNLALHHEMKSDNHVVFYGIGIFDEITALGTSNGLLEKYGSLRCFETPLSEDSMTGLSLGAALAGLKPVQLHIRADFLMLAMNQIVNMISSFQYSTKKKTPLPIVIRVLIGRGWGQGFQHSKSLFSYFTHLPGLEVVAPVSPNQAYHLLRKSIQSKNPTIFFEHRWLYSGMGQISKENKYNIGKSIIEKKGGDITIIAISWMVVEARQAAEILKKHHNISVEIINPLTLRPIDYSIIYKSVKKTSKIIIADCDWLNSGLSAEISSSITENCFKDLTSPPVRIGNADSPCPTVRKLETEFYPNSKNIVRAVERMFNKKHADLTNYNFYSHEEKFRGPF